MERSEAQTDSKARFAALFVAWMRRTGLKSPAEAAPLLSRSVAAAYTYANGTSLPPNSQLPALARIMGLRERALRRAIDRDRAARLHAGKATRGGAA